MNPALLYYLNGPDRDCPTRKIPVRESRKTLGEAKQQGRTIGFWMIPHGDSYVKLRILDRYYLRGQEVGNLTPGDDPVPVWALAMNFDLLAPHFGWLKQLMLENSDLFTGKLSESKWASAAESFVSRVQKRRWGFYFALNGVGYLSLPQRAAYKTEFAKEMFDDERKDPSDIRADFSVKEINLYSGSNYIDSPTQQELKKILGYGKVEKERDAQRQVPVYRDFTSFIRDYEAGTVKWDKLDSDTIAKLAVPVYVEWTYNRESELRPTILKFLQEWVAFAESENIQHAPLSTFSQTIRRAIEEQAEEQKKKPLNESQLVESQIERFDRLNEAMNFAKLLKLTKTNGGYKRGAMVRVAGVWTTDVTTRNRAENARYVISSPPLVEIQQDGGVIYRWKFKSRADRSTTGLTHRGYLRLKPKKKGIMGFLKRLVSGDGPWSGECEAWCSCQDFRYRSHYVLFKNGASHKPTGQNGDATNEPPLKTNPRNLVYMCKHLVLAGSVFLADPPKKFQDEVKKLQDLARRRSKGADYQPPEPQERTDDQPDNPDKGVGLGGTIDLDEPLSGEDGDELERKDGVTELV